MKKQRIIRSVDYLKGYIHMSCIPVEKMEYGVREKTITLPENLLFFSVLCMTIVVNFLLLVSTIRLGLAALFLLDVLLYDVRLFKIYFLIFAAGLLVSSLFFYHVMHQYTTVIAFLMRNILCWIYMEMGHYALQKLTDRERQLSFFLLLTVILFTCITSLIVVRENPEAMRGLGNGAKYITVTERHLYARNTASWGITYAMAFSLPMLICLFKKTRHIIYLGAMALIGYCVLQSQITFALLFALVFFVFLLLKPWSLRQYAFFFLIMLALLLLLLPFVDDVLLWVSQHIPAGGLSVLRRRIHQLYVSVHTGVLTGDVKIRLELYLTSLRTFIHNPVAGLRLTTEPMYTAVGLHSQIFDLAASTGLAGLIPSAVCYIWLMADEAGKLTDETNRRYFLLALLVLAGFMIINPTYYAPEVYLMVFLSPVFSGMEMMKR